MILPIQYILCLSQAVVLKLSCPYKGTKSPPPPKVSINFKIFAPEWNLKCASLCLCRWISFCLKQTSILRYEDSHISVHFDLISLSLLTLSTHSLMLCTCVSVCVCVCVCVSSEWGSSTAWSCSRRTSTTWCLMGDLRSPRVTPARPWLWITSCTLLVLVLSLSHTYTHTHTHTQQQRSAWQSNRASLT